MAGGIDGIGGRSIGQAGEGSPLPQQVLYLMDRMHMSIGMYPDVRINSTNAPQTLEAIQAFITYYEANPTVQTGYTQTIYNYLIDEPLYNTTESFKDLASDFTSGKNPAGAIQSLENQWIPGFTYPQPFPGPPLATFLDQLNNWYQDCSTIPPFVPSTGNVVKGDVQKLLDAYSDWKNHINDPGDRLYWLAVDINRVTQQLQSSGDLSSLDGQLQELSSLLNTNIDGQGSLSQLAAAGDLDGLKTQLSKISSTGSSGTDEFQRILKTVINGGFSASSTPLSPDNLTSLPNPFDVFPE